MTQSFCTKFRRRSLVLAAALLLSATGSAQNYRSPELRQSDLSKAYQKLQHAKLFNLGGVGFGAQITDEEKAFATIFDSATATILLQRLLNDASPEGKLYALFGLRLKAPETFHTEAERLKEAPPEPNDELFPPAKGRVRLAHGCLLYEAEFQVAVEQIAKGQWDPMFRSGSRAPLN